VILEEALKGEVRDRVGRERYERADGEAKGYRNGYQRGRMKTAEGTVEFSAPQVRDMPDPFVSEIRENLTGRTQALEDFGSRALCARARMRLRTKAGVGCSPARTRACHRHPF
jgi:putative transposase